ncbi:MAG: alanine:cation symporter family protein, partial [Acidobacteria bacterium]|nr:alanine:cation symporter family protein [Acidobacteriota bacterium]
PLVLVCSVLFGLTTLITWSFYGEQSAGYLFGPQARRYYRVLYCGAIAGGAIAGPRLTWAWADILNGMMAIPNLVALLAMAGGLAGLIHSPGDSPEETT